MSLEQGLDRREVLNTSYNFFLDIVDEFNIASADEDYLPLILIPKDKALERIQRYRDSLSRFAVTPDTAQDPRVQLAHRMLDGFFQANQETLQQIGVTVVYIGGSLLYDDPNHCDADLRFIVDGSTDVVNAKSSQISTLVENEFDSEWRKKFGQNSGVEHSVHSLDQLSRIVTLIETDEYVKIYRSLDPFDQVSFADYFLSNAAYFLTAYPLVIFDPAKPDEYRVRMEELLKQSALLRGKVLESLTDTLKWRLKRRKTEKTQNFS